MKRVIRLKTDNLSDHFALNSPGLEELYPEEKFDVETNFDCSNTLQNFNPKNISTWLTEFLHDDEKNDRSPKSKHKHLVKELELLRQKNSILSDALFASKQKAALLHDTLSRIKIKLLEEAKAKASANELAKALAKAKSKIEQDAKNDNQSSDYDGRNTAMEISDGEAKIKIAVNNRREQEIQLEKLAVAQEDLENKKSGNHDAHVTADIEFAKQERKCLVSALLSVEEEIKLLQTLRSKTGLEVRDNLKGKLLSPTSSCKLSSTFKEVRENLKSKTQPGSQPNTRSPSPFRLNAAKRTESIQLAKKKVSDLRQTFKGAEETARTPTCKNLTPKSPKKFVDTIDLAKKKVSDLRKSYEELMNKASQEKELFATARDKYYCMKSDADNLKALQRKKRNKKSNTSMSSDDVYEDIYDIKTVFASTERPEAEGILAIDLVEGFESKSDDDEDDNGSTYSSGTLKGISKQLESDELYPYDNKSDYFIAAVDPVSNLDKKEKFLRSSFSYSRSMDRSDSLRKAISNSNISATLSIDEKKVSRVREQVAKKILEAVVKREEAERALSIAKQHGNAADISIATKNMMEAAEIECTLLESATETVEEELTAIKGARCVTDEALQLVAVNMCKFTWSTLAKVDETFQALHEDLINKRSAVEECSAEIELRKEDMVRGFGQIEDQLADSSPKSKKGLLVIDINHSVEDENSDDENFHSGHVDQKLVQAQLEKASKSMNLQQQKAARARRIWLAQEAEAFGIRINREKEESAIEECADNRTEEESLAQAAADNNDYIEEAR